MLITSLKTPRTLEHDHSGLAGPHLDAFTGWLKAQRYQSRRLRHLLRGAHRFSCWAHSTGFTMQALDAPALDAYGHHLQEIRRLRYPSGRYSHLLVGARHLVRFLETRGVVASATSILPVPPEPPLLEAFRQWMQIHRGTTQATLNGYRLTITALLHTLGDQPERLTAQALRAFVLERTGQGGMGRAKTVVTAVRRFLRVLLARLGFRVGDVAALQWHDLDWPDGTLCVVGKSRRATRLLLPQDVGRRCSPLSRTSAPACLTRRCF